MSAIAENASRRKRQSLDHPHHTRRRLRIGLAGEALLALRGAATIIRFP